MKITLLIIAIAAAGFMFRNDIARVVSPASQTGESANGKNDKKNQNA